MSAADAGRRNLRDPACQDGFEFLAGVFGDALERAVEAGDDEKIALFGARFQSVLEAGIKSFPKDVERAREDDDEWAGLTSLASA